MSNVGSLTVVLEGNIAKLESDLGKGAAIADARSKEMARSFSVVQKAIADQKGIGQDVLKPYMAQLETVGMSARATAAALRGVPAQFTDIVTSLQGGQAPLTVLLQQGGQLKDMFGGIGPAAKALGGYVAGLITPFNVAAVAVASLAVAMAQGSQESKEYAKALILTGNAIGLTTDQLKEMAVQVAGAKGTQGAAAEALAALAQSGKVARDSLSDVGKAVVAMNQVLGTSIDDATTVFTRLADEPAKASLKLNEQMHYLTQTTYERIRALEDQGRKEEAAALAQTTYATATTSRLQAVQQQVGFLSRFWQGLSTDAKKAWDEMQGLGRQKTTGETLADAQAALAARQARGPTNDLTKGAFEKGNARLQSEIAALSRKAVREQEAAFAEGERARDQSAKIAASDRLKTLTDEVKTNADKRKKAIDDLNRDFKTLGKATSGSEYDKLVANINEKFKDPKGEKPKAFQDDAATKFLETQRQVEASLAAQLQGESKLTAAEQEKAKFTQLIADLKGKTILTDEQKSLLANEKAIQAQLDKNVALSQQVEYENEIKKITEQSAANAKEFARQVDAVNISIASAMQSRGEQQDRTLSAFGLGARAAGEIEAQKSIRKEFETYKRQLTKEAASKDQLGSDEYRKEVERIQAALNDSLDAQQAYFDALKSKQADWQNGATTALANYIDTVNNVSAATEQAFSDGFRGAEDALVQFTTNGKADVKSLATSIIADLERIAIRKTITGPLANGLLGALGGGGYSASDQAGLDGLITGLSGARADGGPVVGGSTYLVGENGPELFKAGSSGMIIPNDALHGGGGGGGNTYHYNFTVGDVATVSMVQQAIAASQRQTAGAFARSQQYGGALA